MVSNDTDEKMESVPEIIKEFGQVFCGRKAIEHVKIRNTSKKVQEIGIVPLKEEKILYGRLRICPQKAVADPGKPVRFTLTYAPLVENLTDIISYNIFECEKLVARLNVRARTLGPGFPRRIYNVKFFRFHDVKRVMKNITLENLNNCEAKFYFDLDEDYKQIQISQTHGVIPAESKICLKMFFNSSGPGIYYKTIFCLLQYHPPLIFNVLGISHPKLKLEPKSLNIRYPLETRPDCNYAAYMEKLKVENTPEGVKIPFLQKCAAERERLIYATNAETEKEVCWSAEESEMHQLNNSKTNKSSIEVFLTTYFVDIRNEPETLRGTTLVNFSKIQRYYYEWDQDPNGVFRMYPDRGVIEPNMKTNFDVYFSPLDLNLLYHTEIDLRIFPCDIECKVHASDTVDLPLTHSLRILGNSFPDDSCRWMAQCTVFPKTLQLRCCVPGENVYGTFMIQRQGHLPVSFHVVNSKEMNYSVQPPLGFLSRDFQLFVIEFNAKAKEEGVYLEDVTIMFNNEESTYDVIKVATSVETPKLTFGKDNSHAFQPIFPGARTSDTIPIKNPTNLHLSYEFKTPEELTWCEVVNPKGEIEPNSFSEVTIIFKPKIPCEYADHIPCYVASVSKMDFVKVVHLYLMGSCQYGYLVATPSIHDYGECIYLEQKSIDIHLFNFSPVLINFQLIPVHRAFPVGDVKKDVLITPDRGSIPGKSSLKVQVAVTPHDKDVFQYAILCQNLVENSENAITCDEPRPVFLFRFEGVLPSVQIIDLTLEGGGGHLFSPHWLWKMMNINRMNRGFNSLEREFVVNLKFPEALVKSPPMSIFILIEANRHGHFVAYISKKILCPCLEASDASLSTHCIHSTVARLSPNTVHLRANERMKLELCVAYEEISPCSIEWTINIPHGRKVILHARMVALPNNETLSIASMYLNPVFHLKPVFIGDPSPPLQLFWLYNNTDQPAVYNVVQITLWDDFSNTQRIFECINPSGEIPPWSSLPLKFLFTPIELKNYKAQVILNLHESTTEKLQIEGEGVAGILQNHEFGFKKTLPKVPNMPYTKVDLYCLINNIDIDFHRTFSKIKRIFFVKNRSTTLTWSFRWHTFVIDKILSTRIYPSEGRIEPGQKTLMTLIFESFSYPTTASFSIPCDVINYSALKAYEEAVRLQEMMTEKAKDYFTITEKGITYETPEIEIPEKPKLRHIFISINVNIFNPTNVETKLRPDQQWRLKAENEMETGLQADVFLKISDLPPILQVLEKSLWNILDKNKFWRKLQCTKNSNHLKYLQFLPETRSKRKQGSGSTQLQRSYIQSFLETEIKEVLYSKITCATIKERPNLDKFVQFNVFKN